MNWEARVKKFAMVSLLPLTSLSLVIACQARSEPASQVVDRREPAQVRKTDMPGITNFSRLDGTTGFGGATVGFGGATPPTAMAALKAAGFTSVISLRLASESGADIEASRAAAEAAGLRFIHVPFDAANPDPKLVDHFLAAVGNTANQPPYIYCASSNRVGALWMVTRAVKDGWEIARSRDEAVAAGMTQPAAEAFAVDYITKHAASR